MGSERLVSGVSSACPSPAVSRANSKGHSSNKDGGGSPSAHQAALSTERNLALVLFAIVVVFLVCHTGRMITTIHEPNQLKNFLICQQVRDIDQDLVLKIHPTK